MLSHFVWLGSYWVTACVLQHTYYWAITWNRLQVFISCPRPLKLYACFTSLTFLCKYHIHQFLFMFRSKTRVFRRTVTYVFSCVSFLIFFYKSPTTGKCCYCIDSQKTRMCVPVPKERGLIMHLLLRAWQASFCPLWGNFLQNPCAIIVRECACALYSYACTWERSQRRCSDIDIPACSSIGIEY